jgi:subtilisin
VRRVGTLASPTAKIDQRDERVDADIAVLDSGVDPTQPDLNVRGGVNCNGDKGFDDPEGHGTQVSGVAAALDNPYGVVGVAPGARIWSARVANADGLNTDATVLCGLDWVAERSERIEVANMSLGDAGSDDGHCGRRNADPIHWAVCHVVGRGVTIVASARNEPMDAASIVPAAYPQVMTVSGMSDTDGEPGGHGPPRSCEGDPDDAFAALFSNFGKTIDISAPAECVGSLFPGGLFALDSGTSFAAPHVSGAAALYLARHPGASPAQVKAGYPRQP